MAGASHQLHPTVPRNNIELEHFTSNGGTVGTQPCNALSSHFDKGEPEQHTSHLCRSMPFVGFSGAAHISIVSGPFYADGSNVFKSNEFEKYEMNMTEQTS